MHKNEYLAKMEKYWDETGKAYSQTHELFLLKNGIDNYKRGLELVDKKERLNLHEVATGGGLLADYIVSQDNKKFSQMVFADLSDVMVKTTQERLNKLETDKSALDLTVAKGDCEELERFPANHFNLILANFVMQLIQNLDSVFKGIAHCMSEDGVFAISYFDKKETSSYHTYVMEIAQKHFKDMNKEKDVNLCLDDQLPLIIEKHGLYIAERSVNNIIYDNSKADYKKFFRNYLLIFKHKYDMDDKTFELVTKDIDETVEKIKANDEVINIKAINIFVKKRKNK